MSDPTPVRERIPPDALSDEHLLVALTGSSDVRDLVSSQSLSDLADHTHDEPRPSA